MIRKNEIMKRLCRLENQRPFVLDDDNFITAWNDADELSRAFWIAEAQGVELLQHSRTETETIRRGLDRLHIEWNEELTNE